MVGAALIPLVNLDTRRALAADRVPENDPMAQALKYVEASPRKVRCAATAPTRKLRKLTGTRLRHLPESPREGYGWCSAWVKGA